MTLPLIRLITLRHLLRARLRTVVTMIGIALGVGLYVAIRLCNESVNASLRDSLGAISGAATLEVLGGDEGFDERVYSTVVATAGVQAAAPVIQRTVAVEGDEAPLIILGIDPLSDAPFRRHASNVLDDFPEAFLLDPTAVLLTERFARDHDLERDDPLDIIDRDRTRRLTVVGRLPPSRLAEAWGGRVAFMDLASAQWTLDRLGRLDRIDVLTDPAAADHVAAALREALPHTLVVQRPERRLAHTEQVIRSLQINLTALSGIALLVGLFLIYNTMTHALLGRRSEIGLLRALGVTRARLFGVLTIEALVFGFAGGVVGIPLGWALAWAAVGTVSHTVEALYQGAPAHSIVLTARLAMEGLALGGLVATAAAMIPITEALRVVPREVLHIGTVERRRQRRVGTWAMVGAGWWVLAAAAAQADPIRGIPVFGYAAALCVVLGGACWAPLVGQWLGRAVDPLAQRLRWVEARLAGGTLSSAPGRTAVAVGALMTALAMMVSVVVMVGSFRRTVERWIEHTISADLYLTPAARRAVGPTAHFQDDTVVAAVRAVPGVAAVDPYRQRTIEYEGRPRLLSARDLSVVAQRSALQFVRGDSQAVLARLAAGEGVAVSEVFARAHRVREGSTITLSAGDALVSLPILAVFYDYATDGGRILMDRSVYLSHWGDRGVNALAVYLVPGADRAAIDRTITAALHPARVEITPNHALKREVLDVFDQTFAITRALDLVALAVAMLGIANTVFAIMIERRGELGVLRALGATRFQLGHLVLCEAGLIGVLGAVLGVGAGFGVSLILIHVVNVQSFGWTIGIWWSPLEVAAAAGLAFIAALVAGWWPAHRAARLPIVEVLHHE